MIPKNQHPPVIESCSIHVLTNNRGVPALEIRAVVSKKSMVNSIVAGAIYHTPVIIMPMFHKPIEAWARLCEKGVLYYDRDKDEYFFNERVQL